MKFLKLLYCTFYVLTMISIEAYRAAIGRHNRRKHINTKRVVPNFYTCKMDPAVFIACYLMTFVPLAFYFMLLLFICIAVLHLTMLKLICLTVDRVTKKFTRMYVCTREMKTFANDFQMSSNKTNGHKYVMNKKKEVFLRYICLTLILTSCVAFMSINVPSTMHTNGNIQNSNEHSNCMLKNLEL